MKLRDSSFRSTAGFTLLEVVVAMAIVGLGVVTLLEVFSSGLRLEARSAVRTEAIASGRQVIDERLVKRTLPAGIEEGALDQGGRWQLRVQPVKQDPNELTLSRDWELQEVALEVIISDAGRERRVELKTMRLVKRENG
ncbi:MAG TPA: prepilin-type N-terminal cleavage/methylation domain-containing protein [Terriglobales bacterium]|nr:prepilin-type N-terminal cleavage/methylation domain-containing protein [Terriglobales bacterium]